jgi:ATP-dependent DNA helicase RecG
MIIEHAERFGLAQLHQLRGRVGRGGDVSYCILITPDQIGDEAKERIQIFTSTNNGFLIAEADLKLRGMGDLDGTRQSGAQMFRFIEPISDDNIIKYAQKIAMEILKKDPSLETSSYICLRNLLENTWQGLRFFDIA